MIRYIITIAIGLLLSGCSTTVPLNYIPASSIRGESQVNVALFRYLPADAGKVAPNQFQKNPSSLGEMFTSTEVASFVMTALKKELAYSGFRPGTAHALIISGDVTRFYYDWLGFSEVDFEIGIDFKITQDGKEVFRHSAFSHQKAPKSESMSQDSEAVRAAVSACIDDFLAEARVKGVL